MAAHQWPRKRRLLGTRQPRLDGPSKSTGQAKYSYDVNPKGLLHAMILRSPHAHAKIKTIDVSGAEKSPGFKALHMLRKEGEEVYFVGAEILGVACDTEEHCHDALRAIKVVYDVLPFQVIEQDALKQDLSTTPPVDADGLDRANLRPPSINNTKGDPIEGFRTAEAVVEVAVGAPNIVHQCLESHGLVAEWDADQAKLTAWASTQAVINTAALLGNQVKPKPREVVCITEHMGGGYGSKFGPDIQGVCAAQLALLARAPVKLMLDRTEEVYVGGTRPSAFGKVRLGGNKDGTITAYEVDCYGSPGTAAGNTVGPLPYVYPIPNTKVFHRVIRLNAANARAMRAPGHPQSCLLTECAIDAFAAKIGMDPMQVRLKNLPPAAPGDNPIAFDAIKHKLYTDQLEMAARRSDWAKKWHPPGASKGVVKHGIGMALHTWGGSASPQRNECTVTINRDGEVMAQTSTQDLGTGQRTVTALVTAEILGLKQKDIVLRFGQSPFGSSSGSGGSTTLPSQGPATLQAASAARDELFKIIAPRLNANAEDLAIEVGKVVDTKNKKEWSWKQACAKLGMDVVKAVGFWTQPEANKKENRGVSNVQVGGVQVAEVLVDTETGVVRCTRVVAVQDCGLIVNLLACESQVAGGVIMGLNYALFEERIMDRHTGRQCNPDMEFYKLGGIEDMPDITVVMMDMPERGVIGIGEPPTISTHAAIANAIHNAIGVHVAQTPFTPERVLAALAQKGEK